MLNVIEDITSIEKLGQNLTDQVAKLKSGHRPLIVTTDGEAAVVMLSAEEYQRLVEIAETQTEMPLSEERSNDVAELEEAVGYIYQHFRLPHPTQPRNQHFAKSRTRRASTLAPRPLHYPAPRIAASRIAEPKKRLLVKDLGWTREQALANHYRYRSFAEDWNAPGMEVYDQL